MRKWRIEDSAGFTTSTDGASTIFSIKKKGNVTVTPKKKWCSD
jgi:hypothetical protein